MGSIIGIISLIIYFIWGQGTACAWWMWIPIVMLIISILSNIQIINWICSLFLLGVTFFASPTFGYNDVQKASYHQGYTDGKSFGWVEDSFEQCWNIKEEGASVDVSGEKKYYRYGFKRGQKGKKD